MDVIDTPIVRQSKIWLYARTSDYDPYFMEADILEFFTKWLPPWSKGHNHLFGLGRINDLSLDFCNCNNHPCMCVLSTLCGNIDKQSICIYTYTMCLNGGLTL